VSGKPALSSRSHRFIFIANLSFSRYLRAPSSSCRSLTSLPTSKSATISLPFLPDKYKPPFQFFFFITHPPFLYPPDPYRGTTQFMRWQVRVATFPQFFHYHRPGMSRGWSIYRGNAILKLYRCSVDFNSGGTCDSTAIFLLFLFLCSLQAGGRMQVSVRGEAYM
jgi:hypothetical protein